MMIQNNSGSTQLKWWVNKYAKFYKYWQPVIQCNVEQSLRENYIQSLKPYDAKAKYEKNSEYYSFKQESSDTNKYEINK